MTRLDDIPDAAVEAADAELETSAIYLSDKTIRRILTAALPHLVAERAKAHQAVARALATGKMVRPEECETCRLAAPKLRDGRHSIQGHHSDYSKPLSVMWLCTVCHSKQHDFERRALAQSAAPDADGGSDAQ
jgi:hypothetical protein